MKPKAKAQSDRERERHYRGLLEEHRRSGQSLRAFARERGLSAWTLYDWRRRLAGSGREGQARGKKRSLIAVDVVGACSGGEPSSELEVILTDGVRVRVPQGFDEQQLRGVFSALRGC